MTATAISQSGSLAPDSSKAKTGASSIFALLDRQSKIDSNNNSGMILDNVKGNIEFQHVSFNYPSRPEAQVLKDLCLAISSGEVNSNALFIEPLPSLVTRFDNNCDEKMLSFMLDGCSGGRKWERKINSYFPVAKILRSEFRPNHIRWTRNSKAECEMVERTNGTSKPGAYIVQ